MVCQSCVDKLAMIHEFATRALESQEKLRAEFLKKSTTNESIDRDDAQLRRRATPQDKSLLHSILTKVRYAPFSDSSYFAFTFIDLKCVLFENREIFFVQKDDVGIVESSDEDAPTHDRQRSPSAEKMEVKIDPMLFLQCALGPSSSAENSELSDDCLRTDGGTDWRRSNGSGGRAVIKAKYRRRSCRTRRNRDGEENSEDVDCNDQALLQVDSEEGAEENDVEDDEVIIDYSSSSPTYVCRVCSRIFGSQLALQNHLWSHLPSSAGPVVDSGVDNETTGMSSTPSRDLQRSDDDPVAGLAEGGSCFICPICGKNISTKGNLKVHLETHRPKGKHGCDICGRM